ncbi:LysE family translocator [Leifsonia poae]|uniref:Threonine transporter RhtB n=1 Tax=Leifsonia poae TaxID=110933 RepID=A0A9W6LY70_9MICO|nr:LysE family translocator [Leifsonia poae]GLJ74893.1 threonine transporter RhtB [Leifsonia poae]
MTAASILAFAGLCAVLALTPGPDTFLILRYSLVRMRAGIAASIGSAIGSLIWAAAVAFGLAALLEQSAEAYRIIKIVGGLYLVYLGVSAFLASRRGAGRLELEPPRVRLHSSLIAGAVSTLLNPKVGLFFLAVAPQFIPQDGAAIGNTMLLGAVDALVALVYLAVVSVLASRAVVWLRRPRVTKTLERVSAGILAALGVGTIATSIE